MQSEGRSCASGDVCSLAKDDSPSRETGHIVFGINHVIIHLTYQHTSKPSPASKIRLRCITCGVKRTEAVYLLKANYVIISTSMENDRISIVSIKQPILPNPSGVKLGKRNKRMKGRELKCTKHLVRSRWQRLVPMNSRCISSALGRQNSLGGTPVVATARSGRYRQSMFRPLPNYTHISLNYPERRRRRPS